MKNLIEEASGWLQSKDCRSGNILERTKAVVSAFRVYVMNESQDICDNTGLSLSAVIFPEYHYLRLANANKGTI